MRSLATDYPEIAALWVAELNDRQPSDVAPMSHVAAWWRCPTCSSPYRAIVSNRTRGKCAACPPCSRAASGAARAQSRHEMGRNLAAQYPDIAAELTGDPPASQTSPGSHVARIWKCARCTTLFRASPSSRVNNSLRAESRGCPECWSRIRAEQNRQRVQDLIDRKGSLALRREPP